jgi:soluble lytic murein transglycosylase-like protein
MSGRAVHLGNICLLKAFVFLLLVFCAISAQAQNVLFKLDTNGKKVFYNIPSRNSGSDGSAQGLYYSDRYENYAGTIWQISTKYGVDPDLVKALIQVESNYNFMAVSPKGARGLMQLMPATAARYGVRSVFDPTQNIEGGVRYLKDLSVLFNSDLRLTLAAYNAGEHRVSKINDVPDFVETQNYVRKVLALYNGEMSYIPYGGGGKIKNVTYWKYVDEKGVTHYSSEAVQIANATKVSFAYAW